MKKLLFTLLFITGLAGTLAASGNDREEKANRRSVKEKQVKAYVEAALAATFGDLTQEQWQVAAITREFQERAHTHRNSRKSLFFSPDNAHRLANIEQVSPAELSGKLVRKLARKYKGYQIAQVIRYFDGETLYFVSLKKDQEQVLISYAR